MTVENKSVEFVGKGNAFNGLVILRRSGRRRQRLGGWRETRLMLAVSVLAEHVRTEREKRYYVCPSGYGDLDESHALHQMAYGNLRRSLQRLEQVKLDGTESDVTCTGLASLPGVLAADLAQAHSRCRKRQ